MPAAGNLPGPRHLRIRQVDVGVDRPPRGQGDADLHGAAVSLTTPSIASVTVVAVTVQVMVKDTFFTACG